MRHRESSPLAARLAELALTQPDRPALISRGDALAADRPARRYADLWRQIERITAELQSVWDLRAGDRVAWLGFNHELQLITLIACARLGAVFLPLNFRLAHAEVQQVLDDARPVLLIHDAQHALSAQALRSAGLRIVRLEALQTGAAGDDAALPVLTGQEPVLLVYTSGTTGLPKGAVHAQAALMANARASAWAHEFSPQDRVLSCLPLFHVGGLCIQTLPALMAGVEVVLHPRFDPAAWLDELALSRPTLSLLVPATLRALFEHPRWSQTSLQGLRGIMTGSSIVPLAYLQTLHARGVPVGQIYGTTETGPVSVVLRLADALAHEGSIGWPHPHAQVKIVDTQGREVADGQTGEVCVRADNLMAGYWNEEGRQGLGLEDGWFHCGDLGRRAVDGCITIVGRSKDMIISGGENIYPAEIENLLVSMEGLAECAVVGLPDSRWGEVPVLVLVRAPGAAVEPLRADTVLAYLSDRIARFKLPRRVVFLDALPKSALGKVQKQVLQAQLAVGDLA
ncbi:MAG: long-chain fatty acid--CoA ligase [Betaproteobacteria bacterium]|nr:long-chain fatty acid--CoA ligase [Betaproteobacteria bacterium]